MNDNIVVIQCRMLVRAWGFYGTGMIGCEKVSIRDTI